MSCISTAPNQTEFEFYTQLVNSPDGNDCCGPVVEILFDKLSVYTLHNMFRTLQGYPNHLDRFDPTVLDSRNLSLTMCSRHWLQHIDIMCNVSTTDTHDIAFYVYKCVMLLNGWDEKELSNYLG